MLWLDAAYHLQTAFGEKLKERMSVGYGLEREQPKVTDGCTSEGAIRANARTVYLI
jgi:hypothetical protein